MAQVVLFLVVVGGLVVTLELRLRRQGFRHGAVPPARTLGHSFPPSARRSFTGGLRVGWANVSWPLARLTFDRDAARIRGLLRTVWVPRSEVVAVRRVSFPFSPGIRFETASGAYDGVLFWTFSPTRVLAAFAQLGWPVPRQG